MSAVVDGMLLTVCAIVVGAVLGLVRGGRLRAVLASPVRYWPILFLGAALHTIAEQFAVPGRLTVFIVGSFLLVVSALLNVHLKGAIVSGIGVSLNLAAVVANGHVPIRLDALIKAGEVAPGTDPALVSIEGDLWELETADTSLAPLGDIVPIWFLGDVVSFGDLILIAGLTVLTMNLVLHRRRAGVELDDLLADEKATELETDLTADEISETELDLRDRGDDLTVDADSPEPADTPT